jgi:hypothetical protein
MDVDQVNAVFELGSAALLTLNVRTLARDKKLAGVSIIPTSWFSLWGAWNLIYYKSLGQTFSWIAGIAVFMLNTYWVILAVYYKYSRRHCAHRHEQGRTDI